MLNNLNVACWITSSNKQTIKLVIFSQFWHWSWSMLRGQLWARLVQHARAYSSSIHSQVAASPAVTQPLNFVSGARVEPSSAASQFPLKSPTTGQSNQINTVKLACNDIDSDWSLSFMNFSSVKFYNEQISIATLRSLIRQLSPV